MSRMFIGLGMTAVMDWIEIYQKLPAEAGTYPVKLFTGVERTAYWTGERWVSKEAAKNRRNNDKHLTKLLRFWKPEKSEAG